MEDAGEQVCLVTWEPKWELAESFCHSDHPQQTALAAEFTHGCDDPDTIHMARDDHRRQDAHKSNLERQGTWVQREHRTRHPLAYRPQLRQYIHIDPNDTINPDQDIVTQGEHSLGLVDNLVTQEGHLVNVYDDAGKVVGTITEQRLAILHTAYCHTQHATPELCKSWAPLPLCMELPSS